MGPKLLLALRHLVCVLVRERDSAHGADQTMMTVEGGSW
jgi:hypothetical protein